jgi:uncharacterized protein (DUF433 family)
MTELLIEPVTVPLRRLENGAYRVADTGVPLEIVIHAFDEGYSPEDMVRSWSTLTLRDVYAVLTYYLDHREQVQEYMRQTAKDAEALREEIEANLPRRGPSKEKIVARMRTADAPARR